MSIRVHFGSVVLLAISSTGPSCSSDDAGHPSPEAGGGLDATAGDGGDDASADVDVAPTQAMVRFAHLAADAPAFDVCLATHGTGTFKGPLLAQRATTMGLTAEASASGLTFTDVSAYLAIDPGRYDLRLVAAGSSSCTSGETVSPTPDAGATASDASGPGDAGADASEESDASTDSSEGASADASTSSDASSPDAAVPAGPALPLPPDTTNLPAFVAGGVTTVLLAGELAPAGADATLRAVAVQDDAVLAGGTASLRTINALPAVTYADFGFGAADASWSPLFTDVAFGGAGLMAAPDQGEADANGYLPIAPFGPGTFSVRASSDSGDVATSGSATVSPGTVATIIAAGGKTGDLRPPVLILCSDNSPASGTLSVCNVLP